MIIEDKDIENLISQAEHFGAAEAKLTSDYSSEWELTVRVRRKKNAHKESAPMTIIKQGT